MNLVIATICVLYMIIVIAIGFWTMNKVKTPEDFFIAGRSLGLFVMGITMFATALSGFLFVGGPGLTYRLGMGALWFTFPSTTSFAMAWYIVGKKMRLLTEATGSLTIADAVYHRYDSKLASGLTALATFVGTVAFLASQVLAMGIIISNIFNVSKMMGVVIGLAIITIYSTMGGILAATYTSVFQGAIMAIGSLMVFFIAIFVGGGLTNITKTIATTPMPDMGNKILPQFVGPWGLANPVLAMSWFFILGIGIVGQPHIISRFYMIKDVKKLKWGPLVSVIPAVCGGIFMFAVGLTVRYLVNTGKLAPLANPDDAVMAFLMNFSHPIFAGIISAGVMAAIMSTCDAFINISSAALTRDIPFALGKKLNEKQQLNAGRFGVILTALLSLLAVIGLGDRGVALMGAFGWGTYAATIAPTLALGLNWRRGTKEGAIAAILVGLIVSLGLELLSKLNIYKLPHGIYISALCLPITVLVYVVVSYLTPAPKLNEKIEQILNA
ncbi:sodium/proline symporter [Thermovenabulum sp.]|uniref:sodium/proline symporter n=1 Tax=Thermovenabulum sp. TaxID=3100335 RepID=UPI003C7EC8D1